LRTFWGMSSIVTDRVTATVFCKYLENLHNQDKCEGVVGGAAELLCINPSTLGSRIGKAGNQKTPNYHSDCPSSGVRTTGFFATFSIVDRDHLTKRR